MNDENLEVRCPACKGTGYRGKHKNIILPCPYCIKKGKVKQREADRIRKTLGIAAEQVELELI